MLPLFKKTKELEKQVDNYLDLISQSALYFREGVKDYLTKRDEDFERHLQSLRGVEREGDNLRREIEEYLYLNTLIPESRGDVLALLETTDDVVDRAKQSLMQFAVEFPAIPKEFMEDFQLLSEHVTQAMEAMVCATRAFFREVTTVQDYLHKIHVYEREADQVADRLKRRIFRSATLADLSHKMHLRDFVQRIDLIADYAEDVADRLAIYTIKRSI